MARQIREIFPQGNIQQGRVCSGSSGAADPLVPGFQCRSTRRSKRQHLLWSQHAAPLTFPASRCVGCLYVMLLCLWKVSREIIGEESGRNKAEIFPWSLGLCCWAQPHLWDLSWERHRFMPRSVLFIPKFSVRHPCSSAQSPACAHSSSPLSPSLMDQCHAVSRELELGLLFQVRQVLREAVRLCTALCSEAEVTLS